MGDGSPANPSPQARAVYETTLNLPGLRRGKVRDVYELPPADDADRTPRLLIVATDRISAFDVVMPTPIAGKGLLLTELSTFWLRFIEARELGETHLLSTSVEEIPAAAFASAGRSEAPLTPREDLSGRVTIARRARVIPVECVVRGYLEGSGWREYRDTGRVCGIDLPRGLTQCDRLPEPIFTPATKEELGKHDENISFEAACARAAAWAKRSGLPIDGTRLMETLRERSLAIYAAAAAHALERGIIIADTKFEFGMPVGTEVAQSSDFGGTSSDFGGTGSGLEPIVIDEALTPDSSRFWPLDRYQPGRPQVSFDKQYLREYLESLVTAGTWDKQAPGPVLPGRIVEATAGKYREAMERLTR